MEAENKQVRRRARLKRILGFLHFGYFKSNKKCAALVDTAGESLPFHSLLRRRCVDYAAPRHVVLRKVRLIYMVQSSHAQSQEVMGVIMRLI